MVSRNIMGLHEDLPCIEEKRFDAGTGVHVMQSSYWARTIRGIFLVLCLGWTSVLAADESTKGIHVQVLLGATRYDNLSFEHQSATDPSVEAVSEITLMPALGICGAMPLLKDPVAMGVEGGALLEWRSDEVTAVGRGGALRVFVDNKVYLLDFFFGPYASVDLGPRARLYAGAGPLLMVGQYEKESDEEESGSETIRDDNTSMAFGAGFYARTGIEFRFEDESLIGICVRGFGSKVDFEDVPDDPDVKGFQILMTFTPKP
ncbi:MAG: hypothetical protein MUD15_13345 [Desulfobacterota bacterium]|nr:hypothetical protein [Thermodesulfobacteriota bacterium]